MDAKSFMRPFYATQVYQLSIGAACGLSWPSDRIIIQVLDDSTDPAIKVLVSILSHFKHDLDTCLKLIMYLHHVRSIALCIHTFIYLSFHLLKNNILFFYKQIINYFKAVVLLSHIYFGFRCRFLGFTNYDQIFFVTNIKINPTNNHKSHPKKKLCKKITPYLL